MTTYQLGIRKNVEGGQSQYWLMINAKSLDAKEYDINVKAKFHKATGDFESFRKSSYWTLFVSVTIMLDVLITLNYFAVNFKHNFVPWAIVAHCMCLIYWIDIIMYIVQIAPKNRGIIISRRKIVTLTIDVISLLPLSAVYLMIKHEPDRKVFFGLRCITLLRLYRIPLYLSRYATGGKESFQAFLTFCVIYIILSINIFATAYLLTLTKNSTFEIKNWNSTMENTLFVSIYFSVVTHMNTGLGDITPTDISQIVISIWGMVSGFSFTTGVLPAAITNYLSKSEIKRELYRNQRAVTVKTLKRIKIDKRVVEKLSDNLSMMWKHKGGCMSTPPIDILPRALQKEIFFDINFAFLNRSLLFSMQPRSFLRSACVRMKNWSFLPGEIIMEPLGMPDVMLCIASGVIEIICEENNETALFSLREGTVLGEVRLFMSMPSRCVIRASTYVEVQALVTIHFTRLVLKFPDIYRSMREEIRYRIKVAREASGENINSKNTLKNLLQELRQDKKTAQDEENLDNPLRKKILSLYVISENIPRVKLIPIELIRKRPWIIRPHTSLLKGWNFVTFIFVLIVATLYPILGSFIRTINSHLSVLMFMVQVVYVLDLIIQCLTALERDDGYTYATSVKTIMARKLRTPGFYVDAIASLDLTPYNDVLMPNNPDYAFLILSQNKLLKIWYIPRYFSYVENNLDSNLSWVRPFKYILYLGILIIHAACILHWEACPGEQCKEERWVAQLEKEEVANLDPSPATEYPTVLSMYFSTILLLGIGYGDIVAKSLPDCLVILASVLVGTSLLIYIISEAATTSKYAATVRSEYQTEIFAVDRFMREHEIPKHLLKRTRDYFQLQWNYDQGFSLKHNSIKEKLTPQEREIIIKEVTRSMVTVPLFEEANSNFIRILSKLANIRVLSPNQPAIKPGSFRQPMYILERGYCEVRQDDKRYVIGPITPIAYVEMILGIPVDMEITTLTHCRIFSLAYTAYLIAITKHPPVKELIDERIKRDYPLTIEKGLSQSSEIHYKDVRTVDESTARRQREILSKSFINVCKYKNIDGQSYWQPFSNWGRMRFMQFFLLPFVITPNSLFLKIWMSIRIVSALLIGLVAPIYFSIPDFTTEWFTIIIILQVFAGIDMYLMFHVGYYDERGLLIFHPAKTSVNYLKGSFVLDLIAIIPFYAIFALIFHTKGRILSLWYKTPGFLMVLQFYKFSQACYHLEGAVLRQTENIRVLKFLPLTIIVANLITGMMIILECAMYSPEMGLGLTPLEREFHQGIAVYCVEYNANVTAPAISPLKFYIIAYYWVIQTLTACGFGDIHAHDSVSMVAIIVMGLVGLFLFCYMFANLTSGMFFVHANVTQYRSKVLEMTKFMKTKNVKSSIQRRLYLHYGYNWQRTEGQSPQLMFSCLNAILRQSILTSLYGSVIGQIPAFVELEQIILQIIGKELVEIYFLRGETIVKHNDAQEYIYLIYTGRVKVLNKAGETLTVMGSGGLFGNICNKPFYLSSVEVVATENIDVLELHSEYFFSALQAFPKAKPLIEFLTSRTTAYIEPATMSSEERLKKESADAYTYEDTIPYEMEGMGRKPRSSIVDPGRQTYTLHLGNSIYKAKKPFSMCIILPESWLHNLLGVWYFTLAVLSCAITLYRFAFQDYSVPMYILIYFLDLMFYIKIGLQFCISYFDINRNYVINMKKIRDRYFRSKTTLALDIAANLPLDLFAVFVPSNMAPRVLTFLRLNRLLRLSVVFEFYEYNFKVLMINKMYLELSRILVFIFLMIHTCACCWFFVACPLGYCQNPSWVQSLSLQKKNTLLQYTYSVYYIIYVITSTGYGDIDLHTSAELILSIIVMITSRFFIVLLAGSLGSVVHAHKINIFIYQDHIEELRSYFIRQRISKHQLTKMWKYVTSLWFFDKGKQIPEFISMAPYSMKCDVMNAMFGKHLSESCIFSNLSDDFTRQLSIYLQRFIFFPGNYIVQQGDIDNTMFFIHKGEVSVLTIHMNLKETIHFTLVKNDHFGLKQGLIAEKAHLFTYRAKTTVEILSLAYKDWQHLLSYFPDVSQKIFYRLGQLT